MAQVNITVLRGNQAKDVAISSGALTLASDGVALSFNQSGSTGLARGEVIKAMELFLQFLNTHSFPPA